MSNFGITINNMPKVTNEVGQILGLKIEKLQGSQILAALEKAATKIQEQQKEIARLRRFEQEWNDIEERNQFRNTFVENLDENMPTDADTDTQNEGTDTQKKGTSGVFGGTLPVKWVLVAFVVITFFFVGLYHGLPRNADAPTNTEKISTTPVLNTPKVPPPGSDFEKRANELEIKLLKLNSKLDNK